MVAVQIAGRFVNPAQLSRGQIPGTASLAAWDSHRVPRKATKAAARNKPESVYSLRLADDPDARCAICRFRPVGDGLVGYRDAEAICDLCLLDEKAELGMTVALISVTRLYAILSIDAEDCPAALREMGIFARLYECVVARTSRLRPFRILDLPWMRDS